MLESKTRIKNKSKRLNTDEIYDDGFLRVEHFNYHVACNGEPVKLARAEFLIVSFLARKAERYVSAEAIWQYLWKGGKPLNLDSLHVLIYRVRRRFELLGVRIETMVGVGYKLIPAQAKTAAAIKYR